MDGFYSYEGAAVLLMLLFFGLLPALIIEMLGNKTMRKHKDKEDE